MSNETTRPSGSGAAPGYRRGDFVNYGGTRYTVFDNRYGMLHLSLGGQSYLMVSPEKVEPYTTQGELLLDDNQSLERTRHAGAHSKSTSLRRVRSSSSLGIVMNWLSELILSPDRKLHAELDRLLAGRQQMNDEAYYATFFKDGSPPFEIVKRTRNIITIQLGKKCAMLQPDDDFCKEFNVLWQLDSLGDVELVLALEEEFKVTISEAQAAAMTTPRKIMLQIDELLQNSPHHHTSGTLRKPPDA